MTAIIARIYRASGWKGFYDGWSAYMAGSIQPAIQFTAYDQVRVLYLRMASRGSANGAELTAAAAFLLGGSSRMFSELLTYPTM